MPAHDRRWANPIEFEYYSAGYPRKALCRLLRRCDRTVRDWCSGRRPVPAWAVEVLRLRCVEGNSYLRRLGRPAPFNADFVAEKGGTHAAD